MKISNNQLVPFRGSTNIGFYNGVLINCISISLIASESSVKYQFKTFV